MGQQQQKDFEYARLIYNDDDEPAFSAVGGRECLVIGKVVEVSENGEGAEQPHFLTLTPQHATEMIDVLTEWLAKVRA